MMTALQELLAVTSRRQHVSRRRFSWCDQKRCSAACAGIVHTSMCKAAELPRIESGNQSIFQSINQSINQSIRLTFCLGSSTPSSDDAIIIAPDCCMYIQCDPGLHHGCPTAQQLAHDKNACALLHGKSTVAIVRYIMVACRPESDEDFGGS